MILAGDVGGTHTRLAFFELRNGKLEKIQDQIYASRDFPGLGEIVADFIAMKKIHALSAGVGIAGPVRNQCVRATNLPWVVDARQLAQHTGIPFLLLNDLEANAYGLATLTEDDFVTLQRGVSAAGNAAVVSPGTGLGEAGLFWDGKEHHPIATEGGHASFAPENDLQDELLRYLRTQFGHVSWERIVCGPGLFNIYKFLRDTKRGEEPDWLADQLKADDPTRVISVTALEGKSSLCEQALEIFAQALVQECGNMALKFLATGGVYIGGGIPPKILPKLQAPEFVKSFVQKGRFQPLLETIPLRVIMNEFTALRGAARRAFLALSAAGKNQKTA